MRTSTLLAGLVAMILLHPALTALGQQTKHLQGAVHVIQVRQAITGGTARFIQSAIDKATETGAECLIIQLDTPGGLLSSTREIVQSILNAKVPVVVYISPQGARGASAGTMITLASHVAAMAPATHIGAARPVSLFGGNDNKIMNEKVLNDTSAYVEGIAELRHRNAKWAISAVRESKSITSARAKAEGVIEIIAENLDDLIEQLNGREVRMDKDTVRTLVTAGRAVIDQEMTFSQDFLTTLSNPNLIFFLLALGVLGLYIEFSSPGLIFPGVVGGISLIVALIAMQTLPISYGALGLIGLGVALLAAEAFVPSFGLLGIGGLASLLFGSLFLLDSSQTDLQVSRPMVLITVGTVALVILFIGRLLLKSFHKPLQSIQSNMEGHTAEVKSPIDPQGHGMVVIHGELWKARADAAIPLGQKVVVEQVDGLVLRVKVAPAEAGAEEERAESGG